MLLTQIQRRKNREPNSYNIDWSWKLQLKWLWCELICDSSTITNFDFSFTLISLLQRIAWDDAFARSPFQRERMSVQVTTTALVDWCFRLCVGNALPGTVRNKFIIFIKLKNNKICLEIAYALIVLFLSDLFNLREQLPYAQL